ncbi:MAG: hypothetical protein J6B57_06190 [Oscillospiraceae bacterium]|nr:hypothetical protein [Oscillospiraceae bacterium]
MSEILAFIKAHRRDIISTAAVLALDAVMLLVVYPLAVNIENFILRAFILAALVFVIFPAIFLAAGIYVGRDLKRRWHIAVLLLLFYIRCDWLTYIYIAIELVSMIITLIIKKCCKNKADKQENHNV